MALYDFRNFLKRLLLPYALISALHIVVFRGEAEGGLLLILGLLISAVVGFFLFWRDYMGKNALLVNTLPIGSLWKVLCKLFWSVLFTVLFYCVFSGLSVLVLKQSLLVLRYADTVGVVLFFLNGYSAMGMLKHYNNGLLIGAGIILFNAAALLITIGVYMLSGYAGALIAAAVMSVLQFFISAYKIEG